jgi:outer membrane lipoprotein-sorting protein
MRNFVRMLAIAGAALACTAAGAEEEKKAGGEAVGVGSGWSAEVAPSGTRCITLDEQQAATVKLVSDYFAGLGSLKGAFVQTGADTKRMKGKFYLQRPGKFRFEYALPSKQLIVSDGEYLAIQDLDLNNEDRVELDQTPFRLLLKKEVDLVRDACINEVQSAEDLIVVALEDRSPDTPGRIKLFLAAKPAVELKEWLTTDAQGQPTKVEISELDKADDLKPELFKIEPVGLSKFHPQ